MQVAHLHALISAADRTPVCVLSMGTSICRAPEAFRHREQPHRTYSDTHPSHGAEKDSRVLQAMLACMPRAYQSGSWLMVTPEAPGLLCFWGHQHLDADTGQSTEV